MNTFIQWSFQHHDMLSLLSASRLSNLRRIVLDVCRYTCADAGQAIIVVLVNIRLVVLQLLAKQHASQIFQEELSRMHANLRFLHFIFAISCGSEDPLTDSLQILAKRRAAQNIAEERVRMHSVRPLLPPKLAGRDSSLNHPPTFSSAPHPRADHEKGGKASKFGSHFMYFSGFCPLTLESRVKGTRYASAQTHRQPPRSDHSSLFAS